MSEEAIEAYGALTRKVIDTTAWKHYVNDNELVEKYFDPVQMARYFVERERDLARALAEMGVAE